MKPVASLGDEKAQNKVSPPLSLQCGPDTQWDATVGRCTRKIPLDVPPPVYLPPPSGVIVLRPNGVREQADSCPEGFKEVVERGDWRFCIDPGHPETIPPLMVLPIAGIPYEECLAILERHREELQQIPGVKSVGMGAEGIVVETDNAALLPPKVEDLPIKAVPPTGPRWDADHTLSMPVRPLHGSVAVSELFQGTLTGVVLSKGKPWLIFPTHILANCQNVSPCPPGSTTDLDGCPHNFLVTGTRTLAQPPAFPQTVGFVQRWDPLNGSTPSIDTAAAFMDNNTVERDGSLLADRMLEAWGSFTGVEAQPAVNDVVAAVVNSLDPHILGSGIVRSVNQTFSVDSNCNGGLLTPRSQQMTIEITFGDCFIMGDLEFYQMSSKSGQSAERLGGCLDHPIHPILRPAQPVYLAAGAVNTLIRALPVGTAYFIGLVLLTRFTGQFGHPQGSRAPAALPHVVHRRWGWPRVARARERGKVALEALCERARAGGSERLPVQAVRLEEHSAQSMPSTLGPLPAGVPARRVPGWAKAPATGPSGQSRPTWSRR